MQNKNIIEDNKDMATTGVHNTTWSGALASPVNSPVQWYDFTIAAGFYVSVSGDAASASSIVMDTPLPSNVRPSSTRIVSCTLNNGGNIEEELKSGFSDTGTNGIVLQLISYTK